jgi:hypothetical protein
VLKGIYPSSRKYGIVGFTASVQLLSNQVSYLMVLAQNTLQQLTHNILKLDVFFLGSKCSLSTCNHSPLNYVRIQKGQQPPNF